MQDHTPPSEDLHTWMGLRWAGQDWAVRASHLSMVFRSRALSPNPSQAGSPMPVDVEVHGGVPVFVQPLPQVLQPVAGGHPHTADAPLGGLSPLPAGSGWVVAIKSARGSALGCRVDSLSGPFQARAEGGVLVHDQREWRVMTPRTDWHA